jgi:hypothetical protein
MVDELITRDLVLVQGGAPAGGRPQGNFNANWSVASFTYRIVP